MSFENHLESFINNENSKGNFKNYNPESIKKAAAVIGNPQNKYKVFHIAGTNGKGSSAFYIAQILERSGYKTGLFTSPHLLAVNERISINRQNISDNDAVKIIDKITAVCDTSGLTWFDMITLVAYEYFREKQVQFAVIECGLGGRLDSTNITQDSSPLITSISLDHTLLLGNTLDKITSEKAAIIKSPGIAVTSNTEKEVVDVIEYQSKKVNASLKIYGRDFIYKIREDNKLLVNYGSRSFIGIDLSLITPEQALNFSSALALLIASKTEFDESTLYQDPFEQPLGRFTVLNTKPLIIFDCAHNISSIKAMLDTCKSRQLTKGTVFLSLMADKECESIVSMIKKSSFSLVYVPLNNQRSWIPDNGVCTIMEEDNALSYLDRDGINLFCGSFRLYNKMADIINKTKK
ncbi:MAG: hypothetical protein JXK07_09015 [Spirochaetes bacterium]|nr:hypothetical protein [Spirochaetota bacterium]MBN2770784.1 hypothetical protein [Spirochaetota bacterium]